MRTIAQAQQASTAKNAIASAPVGERPIAAPTSTTRQPDRPVEHPPRAIRPRLEVAAPLAPDEEEEERDREEERDPQQPADRREHRLERQHDDDERDQGDDREPAHGPVFEKRLTTPSWCHERRVPRRREPSTANQSSRRRGSAGA